MQPEEHPSRCDDDHDCTDGCGEAGHHQVFPSPSLGPPKLSASPSPPPFCGMPFVPPPPVVEGFGAGCGLCAGGCDPVTSWPAPVSTPQRAPNAVEPSPLVSPAAGSPM